MSQSGLNNFHNSFCANRSVGTATVFVAFCAMMVIAGWNEASGKPHLLDSGVFFLFSQVIALLVAGIFFTLFKCLRERTVIGVSLLTPVGALVFATLPTLTRFRPTIEWIEFAVWTTALVISLSMLISAFQSRRQ